MTNKEILQAAEENAMQYCMQRGIAKNAFVEGAMWARKTIQDNINNYLNGESNEKEM